MNIIRIVLIRIMSIALFSMAMTTGLYAKQLPHPAQSNAASSSNIYPQCGAQPLVIQKENYQKNYMSLRGLDILYVNVDDIIKGAKRRKIELPKNLKQLITDKLDIAGIKLLDKDAIKHVQGQPELFVYASYPKYLGPFKKGEPIVEYNSACCLASTWTSFQQGATILRNPSMNFKFSTWGEGHNTADCSNLSDWYLKTVLKTIDNFTSAKITADSDYEKQSKVALLQNKVPSKNKTKLKNPNIQNLENSCKNMQAITLELFDTDESVVSKRKRADLEKAIQTMKACSSYRFTIETHSDSRSEIEYNKRLSRERANHLSEYLIKKGMEKSRFTTQAFGESKPLSTENTPSAHASNRRVVIIPIKNK